MNQSWNPDHAPHIRAQLQAEKENVEMVELEKRSAPLHWALMLAVVALCAAGVFGQASDYIQRYADMAAANEAMVQCMNGRLIHIDGALVNCDVHEIQLIAEVHP